MYLYSPKFLWIAKSADNSHDYFYELNCYNVLFYGMGLKFINASDKKYSEFNVEQYLQSNKAAPIVIFPEVTKTNKKGALSVKSNVMDSLYQTLTENSYQIRVENLSSSFKYFSPYNTTEYSGLKQLYYTIAQMYNSIVIYSHDVNKLTFSKSATFDNKKFKNINEFFDNEVQSFLLQPEHKYCLSLDCFAHIEFLQYYHSTKDDGSYVKKTE